MIDCIDYVITHKPYPIQQDDLYRTLCVGDYQEESALSERTGKNISVYNDRLNEVTGLYWIWKNADSEYVGLSHYRRFFDYNGYRPDKETIYEILAGWMHYDIILSNRLRLNWSVYHNINMIVGDRLNKEAYDLFHKAIGDKQPDYLKTFEDVMKGNRMYTNNMFVAHRNKLNEYCEWLFSFLLYVTNNVDVTSGTFYQKRVCGYYAEVLWTVWADKNRLTVYEMPVKRV